MTMKTAIIGYGKMGKEIEKILLQRGHEVSLIIDVDNAAELNADNLKDIDVAIEFTTPSTAYDNIRRCLESGTAVVSGTTGWLDKMPEVQELCRQRGGAMFYASNYSLGVNLMFRLNRELARLMDGVNAGYNVAIEFTGLQVGEWKQYRVPVTANAPYLFVRTTGNAAVFYDDFQIVNLHKEGKLGELEGFNPSDISTEPGEKKADYTLFIILGIVGGVILLGAIATVTVVFIKKGKKAKVQ